MKREWSDEKFQAAAQNSFRYGQNLQKFRLRLLATKNT